MARGIAKYKRDMGGLPGALEDLERAPTGETADAWAGPYVTPEELLDTDSARITYTLKEGGYFLTGGNQRSWYPDHAHKAAADE